MGCSDEASIKNAIGTIKGQLGNTITGVTNQSQYATKQALLNQYQSKIQLLEALVKDNCFLNTTTNTDIMKAQEDNEALRKEIEEKEHDIEVAKSRHESVIESQKTPSYYQGLSARLGFTKPFKRSSVSILIALGIMLTIVGFYMGKMLFTGEESIYMNSMVMDSGTFDKKAFLAGVALVAIIVAILSFLGFYGKAPAA
jgi:hypothetical protein